MVFLTEFKRIDRILGMFGFKLYISTRFYRALNFFVRIIGLMIYCSIMVTYFMNKAHSDIILTSWFVSKYVLLIVSHNLFWWKSKSLLDITEDLRESASRIKEQSQTSRWSKNLVILWIFVTLLAFLIALYKSVGWIINDNVNITEDFVIRIASAVGYDFIVILLTYGWLFATVIYYLFVTSAVHDVIFYMRKTYVETFLQEEDKVSTLQEFKWMRQSIQSIQTKLNAHFGLILLAWLLIIVVEICWLMVIADHIFEDYFESFFVLLTHDILYIIMTIGALGIAIQAYRYEKRATCLMLSHLKTWPEDTHELVKEKTRLAAHIGLRPAIGPKIANVVPINIYTTLLFAVLILGSAILIQTLDSHLLE